jgi:hypothetical protein
MPRRPGSPAWHRSPVAAHPRVTVAQGLARGDPEGLPDEIKPGDLLADRMRDRQPGIYFEEGERAVTAEQELAGRRARARVTARPGNPDRDLPLLAIRTLRRRRPPGPGRRSPVTGS